MNLIKQRLSIFRFAITPTLLIVFAMSIGGCSSTDDAQPSYPRTIRIEYRITSSSGLSKVNLIDYTNSTGGSSNVADASIPFSFKTDRSVKQWDGVSLTVVHNNAVGGTSHDLKLEILIDNKVVKTETVEGVYISGAIVYVFE